MPANHSRELTSIAKPMKTNLLFASHPDFVSLDMG
jgi:hypothetical protein